MSDIVIEISQLAKRVAAVRKLLSPLRGRIVPCLLRPAPHRYGEGQILAACQKMETGISFEEWQFDTLAKNFWCQYYELWRPISQTDKRFLERIYLNILHLNSDHDFEKVISIHCDPDEKGPEPQSSYKRGPHLHIQKSESPLNRCHFPLNYSHLKMVLSSIDNVTSAFNDAIQILLHEVLSKYQRN